MTHGEQFYFGMWMSALRDWSFIPGTQLSYENAYKFVHQMVGIIKFPDSINKPTEAEMQAAAAMLTATESSPVITNVVSYLMAAHVSSIIAAVANERAISQEEVPEIIATMENRKTAAFLLEVFVRFIQADGRMKLHLDPGWKDYVLSMCLPGEAVTDSET